MTSRAAQSAFLLFAVPLGLWHWYLAASAIFVFREGEPIASWIAILIGPALTLPLAILSLWNGRAAAWGLVSAAVVSGLATAMVGGMEEPAGLLFGLATLTSGPILVTGLACLVIARMRPPVRRHGAGVRG
jgi:hypothetical protein